MYLDWKFLKTNVRFEISTFEVANRQTVVKIKRLILFGPKFLNLGSWARNFWKQMSDLKSAPAKQHTRKISLRLDSWYFLTKMGIWVQNFSKTNVRFKISTFEIEHMRNFANKIRKVILFDPKYPNLGIWSQNFWTTMLDSKPATSK